jgi:hypothetical protein
MLHISSSSLAESSEHIYHSISIQQFPVCITISLTYSEEEEMLLVCV